MPVGWQQVYSPLLFLWRKGQHKPRGPALSIMKAQSNVGIELVARKAHSTWWCLKQSLRLHVSVHWKTCKAAEMGLRLNGTGCSVRQPRCLFGRRISRHMKTSATCRNGVHCRRSSNCAINRYPMCCFTELFRLEQLKPVTSYRCLAVAL